MSYGSAMDAQKDNEYANYFIKDKPFTLAHKQTFIERITELRPKYLRKEHSYLLCSCVIRIDSTNDPLIKELETFLSLSVLARTREITPSHLAEIVEKHRSTWESNVSFWGGTVSFFVVVNTTPPPLTRVHPGSGDPVWSLI